MYPRIIHGCEFQQSPLPVSLSDGAQSRHDIGGALHWALCNELKRSIISLNILQGYHREALEHKYSKNHDHEALRLTS
jgi:hypothetical protein